MVEMSDKKSSRISIGSELGLTLLWAALGYFVYNGLTGTFAMIILSILYGLATFLSLIPFVGVILQGLLMYFLITPWVFEFTGITATWLTLLVFWIDIIFGCIITLGMSLLVLTHFID
jgi:fructose-specific phosphotransferase system IIC component